MPINLPPHQPISHCRNVYYTCVVAYNDVYQAVPTCCYYVSWIPSLARRRWVSHYNWDSEINQISPNNNSIASGMSSTCKSSASNLQCTLCSNIIKVPTTISLPNTATKCKQHFYSCAMLYSCVRKIFRVICFRTTDIRLLLVHVLRVVLLSSWFDTIYLGATGNSSM